jgi:hypothetical protein
VPPPEFTFELALPNTSVPGKHDAMITSLADAVLGYLGYAPEAIADLQANIRGAMAAGAASGREHCRVAFLAHEGELGIAVTYGGVAVWQTSRDLP